MREDKIIELEEQLWRAMLDSDLKMLDALLHEKLLFHAANGMVVSKEGDIAAYEQGHMKVLEVGVVDRVIQLADHSAVVSTNVKLRAVYMNESIDGDFKFMRVWLQGVTPQVIAGSSHFV
ncbi:MAG: nuclear transport factor 2 family protein [Flavobacteriales bacterium]|nr:nuclear transport factor 2 family protein [Flavobacteriales bacterium]